MRNINPRFKMGYGANLNNNINTNLERFKQNQKRLLQIRFYQKNLAKLHKKPILEENLETMTNLDINDVYEVISNGKPPKMTISPYFKDYDDTVKIKEDNSSDSD